MFLLRDQYHVKTLFIGVASERVLSVYAANAETENGDALNADALRRSCHLIYRVELQREVNERGKRAKELLGGKPRKAAVGVNRILQDSESKTIIHFRLVR